MLIKYDPRSVNRIHVYLAQFDAWLTCELRPDYRMYEGCTLAGYLDELALRTKDIHVHDEIRRAAEIRYQDEMEQVINGAQQRKAELDKVSGQLSKKEKTHGMSLYRKDEANEIRRQENTAEVDQDSPAIIEEEAPYTPSNQIHEDLKNELDASKMEDNNANS